MHCHRLPILILSILFLPVCCLLNSVSAAAAADSSLSCSVASISSSSDNHEASSSSADDDPYLSAANHLYEEWDSYLSVIEKENESIIWAYDYINDYLETNTWKDLSEARTACILCSEYLQELTAPDDTLSESEYDTLLSNGVETALISAELSRLNEQLESDYQSMRYCKLSYLEHYVTTSMNVALKKELPYQYKLVAHNCQYAALLTDYLMVQLFDSEKAQNCICEFQSQYPLVFQEYDSTSLLSCDEAYSQVEKLLEQLDCQTIPEYDEVLDEISTAIIEYDSAIMEEDFETLSSITADITGSPHMFLCPEWYDSACDGYTPYIRDENGTIQTLSYPIDLNEINICGCVQMDGIPDSAVADYLSLLSESGYTVNADSAENNWTIQAEGYKVHLSLKDDLVTFLFYPVDITFTDNPCLY